MKTARYAICRLDFPPFLLLLFAPKISGLSAKNVKWNKILFAISAFFCWKFHCTTISFFCHLLWQTLVYPTFIKCVKKQICYRNANSNWVLVFQSHVMTRYDKLWHIIRCYDTLWQVITCYDSLWHVITR